VFIGVHPWLILSLVAAMPRQVFALGVVAKKLANCLSSRNFFLLLLGSWRCARNFAASLFHLASQSSIR